MARVKRKIAESDFLIESLPQDRRHQFFDIIKVNFLTLLKLGLLLLLFFLPLLVKNYFTYYVNSLNYAAFKAGNLSEHDLSLASVYTLIISAACNLILYPVVFVGLAGSIRVIRQLTYAEGILFGYDFKKGIKNSWKQFVVLGILFALIQLICSTLFAFYKINVLTAIVYFVSVILIVPMIIVDTYYVSIYNSKLGQSLLGSLIVHLKANWKSILYTLLIIAPIVLIEYFLNIYSIKLSIYLPFIILLLPIVLLLGFEIYHPTFDDYINIIHYPEQVRRGLYVSESEKELIAQRKEKLEEKFNLDKGE